MLQAAGHHPNLVHFNGWYRDPQVCMRPSYDKFWKRIANRSFIPVGLTPLAPMPQDGLLCLVMGYCEGGTLSKLLKVSDRLLPSHHAYHSICYTVTPIWPRVSPVMKSGLTPRPTFPRML